MKLHEIVLSKERNVTLTVYLNLEFEDSRPTKRPLLIVLPGGGYAICSSRETEIVALPYMAAGYQVAVLRYTLRDKGGWPYPLNDYDEAWEYIGAHAEEWNIDMERVAVVGFSAGGHLAACAATLAKHKPRAAIPVYPAILPEIVDACQPGMPNPAEHVDANTCPCFLVAARNDQLVRTANALAFAQALEQAGVSYEIHIYSHGGHGFSVANDLVRTESASSRLHEWVNASIEWLGDLMGRLVGGGYTEPVILLQANTDSDDFLSVNCSFAHIRTQRSADSAMEPLYTAIKAIAAARGSDPGVFMQALGNYTVKALLETVQQSPAQIEALNEALEQIPNQK